MSSPLFRWPSSPSSSHPSVAIVSHHGSSPLASPKSSPLMSAEARRRAQYKSRTPSTPLPSRRASISNRRSPAYTDVSSLMSPITSIVHQPPPSHPQLHRRTPSIESPQKAFLRERFMARCLERVRRDREHAVNVRRKSGDVLSDGSSDGLDDVFMDHADVHSGDDDNDNLVMRDELFRRIMQNAERRRRHAYLVSYAVEVGSSVDPDLEDIDRWEHELRGPPNTELTNIHSYTEPSNTDSSVPDFISDEIDLQELEEYATLADFADLDALPDDFFAWSDGDDDASGTVNPISSSSLHSHTDGAPPRSTDIDMS